MTLSAGDMLEIQQLYARYNHAIDSGDISTWVECFTPEGVFETNVLPRYDGAEALKGFAEWYGGRGVAARHWTNNLLLEAEGEGAHGRCYLVLLTPSGGGTPTALGLSGDYEDRMVRTGDGWRFAYRKATLNT